MGFYESSEEILACSYHCDVAFVGCFDCVITGFRCGTIYLYPFLKFDMKNISLLFASNVFVEMTLKVACQLAFHQT
jgi:hypothetical protein